jgi:hypothetical protein
MLKKYLSLTLVVLIANLTWAASAFARSEAIKEVQATSKRKANIPFAETLGVSCVLAGSPSNTEAKSKSPAAQPESEGLAKTKSKPKQNLRSSVLKLVADTKAGKVMPAERPQIQSAKSNNLSTKVKVAIGVGVAVIVLALIVKHARDHLFDNFGVR